MIRKRVLNYCIFLALLAVGLFLYVHPDPLIRHVWPVIQRPILWTLGYTRYDFRPTIDEQRCFNGTVARHNAPDVSPDIPNVVHFVWGPMGNATFPFTLYLAIRAALVTLRPRELRLHYAQLDTQSPWFRELEPHLTLQYHDPASYLERFADQGAYGWDVSHMADVLRLTVLHEQGGIYLDQDCFALRPMDHLLAGNRDVVMGHEGGNRAGLTNAVILAKKGAPFVKRWLAYYAHFDKRYWNHHSVQLPQQLSLQYPDELCALSPSAFFWPMWTSGGVDWMHQPLSPDEADRVRKTLSDNGGALFSDQLVFHAWSHPARRYLERLNPDVLRTEDTRFNIMMRRFLH